MAQVLIIRQHQHRIEGHFLDREMFRLVQHVLSKLANAAATNSKQPLHSMLTSSALPQRCRMSLGINTAPTATLALHKPRREQQTKSHRKLIPSSLGHLQSPQLGKLSRSKGELCQDLSKSPTCPTRPRSKQSNENIREIKEKKKKNFCGILRRQARSTARAVRP